jgi:hypothetical protein
VPRKDGHEPGGGLTAMRGGCARRRRSFTGRWFVERLSLTGSYWPTSAVDRSFSIRSGTAESVTVSAGSWALDQGQWGQVVIPFPVAVSFICV